MKRFGILFIFLLFTTPVMAERCQIECGAPVIEEFYVEPYHNCDIAFRGAGVYSDSHRFREIYSSWSPEVQLEIGKKLWGDCHGWFNAGYLWTTGHSKPLHHKTDLYLVPLSAGLKYVFHFSRQIDLYLGAGGAYSFVHVKNHGDDSVKKNNSRHGWGAVVKSGMQYNFCNGLFLDFFADYLFVYLDKSHHRASKERDLDGLRLGAGLGMHF